MKNYDIVLLANVMISTIFQIMVIVACILLWFRTKNLATLLLLLGSLLSTFIFWFSLIGNRVAATQGAEQLAQFTVIMSIIVQIPNILFSVGFLLFVVQYLKKQANNKNI